MLKRPNDIIIAEEDHVIPTGCKFLNSPQSMKIWPAQEGS